MADITAGMVKELREMTGLGMMECKKALEQALGDMGKAEELLRIRSGAKATKAAQRVAAEGVIGAFLAKDGQSGALVEINCETDFVAKNAHFQSFAQRVAQLATEGAANDVAALANLSLGADGSVEEARKALVMKLGENMTVRRFARFKTGGRLATYVHPPAMKIGVLLDYSGGDEALGKDLAMHIAWSKPIALAKEEIPPEMVARERSIARERALESGKPANLVDKIAEGSVAKYLSEVALLGQPFVKDDKINIEKLLAAHAAKVNRFQLFVVGQGIEKKTADFASEVMAQVTKV